MPTAQATIAGPARRAPGLRHGLAGLTCAVGAMTAHQTAGGDVTALAALLTLVTSVGLAPVLLGRAVDPARMLALSLVAQVVWHAAFTAGAAPGAMAHHVDTSVMAVHHLVAAAVAAAVAAGLERTLARALDWLLGVVRPALARAVTLPVAPRAVPARAALARVPEATPHDPARPLRAPPSVLALG
ncbi:hypothetical protein [Nocardioides marmoraquaticus]